MSWTNKVTWSEGLFLRPQLFQQQERYLETFAHKRALPLSPFYWGFNGYRIDDESLNLGKLVLASASGLFADGTPFDCPAQTPPPAPLSLLPEHLDQLIYLALPIRAPNSEETSFEDSLGSAARFSVFDADIRDANSVGQGAKTIQLSNLRLRLVPQKELTSSWMGLPLAKVTSLRSDGSAELELNLIPPVNRYGASNTLVQWVSQIHGNVRQRRDTLAARLSGSAGGTQAAEVSDFLMLQILNRYEPLLEHMLAVKETPPDQAYTLLRALSGELSTFVRTDTRKPKAHAVYQHSDPYTSFKELIDDNRELLNNVLIRSAESIPLEIKPHGMRMGSVDPSTIKAFGSIVIAVNAQMPPERIANLFPAQAKVAPSDKLAEIVRLHLPGIAMSVLPVPPRQIPFNAGFVYFQLEPRGTLWEHLQTHGGIGLHVASEFPGLHIDVWGIR
jgi:type VI secretion system protein ImpJ